ncbi:filamentous hemagglutinin N-terminal domain-containing protein [Zavarzinia aquatilis]|uniref:Filamentous haemagglutinin FhaB/tRNA nuclease CdiA-like TPS domain-containing protein n=1 Tax=Zavarzinia aquatilis TaxID=2211142 RepID=A0A317EG51_9PROT|nr:filamentous hemagglutinin N-terminal domain-containing protein [Zavarzinia aquatilis]PWR25060.1 hypothetical protein DKG74_04645 [Zavarzinia aquatilis]
MTFAFFPSARRAALLASTALGIVLVGAPVAPTRANPTGGTVVRGEATVTTAPGTVTVRQTTDRAVIDWQDFSVGGGESTSFVQPGRGSVTLNRVTGDDASVIDGKLTANGNVFLVNRNGVLVGAGAQIDVGGLVASTSDIADDAFMAGRDRFDRPTDNPNARVVNEGRITVADKGIAALVGPTVANDGVIAARLGTVALGSAETFTVDLAGDGLIAFDTGQTVDRATGAPQVANSGVISAAGGTIVLDARQASSVVDRAIDMTGVIEAGSISTEGGTVILSGGAGTTAVSGTVDASGTTGGTIEITGRQVAVAGSASLDASGARGGGTVRLGGGPRGTGATPRAETTTVAAGARVDVSATVQGDGGTIAVWSDKTTDFAGTARATGGASGGNGGLIETSSAGKLSVEGASIDASAASGKAGEWLLDPADIAIVNRGSPIPADGVFIPADASLVSIDSIFDVLKTGTNVSIVTNDPAIKGDGNISYLANAAYDLGGVGASLRLEAAGAIDWSGTLQVSNGTLSIDAVAGQGLMWSGTLDGAAADLTLRATAGGSIKIFDGRLVADTIDLRGCMTGAGGCGTDADPYGVGIQPTASGTSGSVPSIVIDAGQLTLLGGYGGIGIDHGADSESSIDIAVGRQLHMQGYGLDPFHIGNGVFSPASTATVLITGAFRNSNLGAIVGAPPGIDVPGLSESELAAIGGFQSLTLRTGAASATFDADEASGSASVLVVGAVPGQVTFNVPFDVFVEVNDGGDFYLASNVTIKSADSISIVTSSPSSKASFLGAADIGGDFTIDSPDIILARGLDVAGRILLDGDVAVAAPAIAVTAGTNLDITGTLDGLVAPGGPVSPHVGLTAKAGSVRIRGDVGFGVGLASLTVLGGAVEIAGVSTLGDQNYLASVITLFGSDSAGNDYRSAAGDITFDGTTMLAGTTAIAAADGGIHFTRDIMRLDSTLETALTLTAGGASGDVIVDGDIGSVEGMLDRVTVAATRSFTLHDVLTSGDQTYAAPLGQFFGETYRSFSGSIVAAATEAALVSGPTLFDAGRGVSFGKVDSTDEGFGGLNVVARAGSIGFFGALGGTTRLSFLTAKASERITADDIGTTGDAMLFAPDIAFTGASYDAGGAFIAHGAMTIARDLSIAGHDLVDLNGDIDLASAVGAGLSVGSAAGDILIGGDVGGMTAIAYLDATAAGEISLANAATEGDQRFSASRVNLGGATYDAGGAFAISGEAVASRTLAITAGDDIVFDGSLDARGDAVDIVAKSGGDLTIFGPMGGIDAFGSIELSALGVAAIGAVDAIGALTVTAGDHIHLLDTHVAAGGDIGLFADLRLAQDARIVSGGSVTIGGKVDGDGLSDGIPSLNVAGNGGFVRIDGAIGGQSAMLDVTLSALDRVSIDDVTTEGSQLYDAPLALLGGATYSAGRDFNVTGDAGIVHGASIEAGGDIHFGGTIEATDGGGALRAAAPGLTARAGGDLGIDGDIGGTKTLGAIDLTATGDILLQSAQATGGISVVAGGLVRLAGTLDAGGDLSLRGALKLLGDTRLLAAGSVLIAGTVDADCTTCLVAAAPGLDIEAATGSVEVTGAIGSLSAPGNVRIGAAGTLDVAAIDAGGSLTLAGNGITLNGASYTAAGDIDILGDTLLTGVTTLAAGGGIGVRGTMDAADGTGRDRVPAPTLTARSNGDLLLAGDIGSRGALGDIMLEAGGSATVAAIDSVGSLNIEAGDHIHLSGNHIVTGGDIDLFADVRLAQSISIASGGSVTVYGRIDGDGLSDETPSLDLIGNGGFVRVNGAIGGLSALLDVTMIAPGRITLGDVTTEGRQYYDAPLALLRGATYRAGLGFTVTGDTEIARDVTVTAGRDVRFGGRIDAIDEGAGRRGHAPLLTADAGGDLLVDGDIGGSGILGGIDLTAARDILLHGVTVADGIYAAADGFIRLGGRLDAGGGLSLLGTVRLFADTLLRAGESVFVDGTIDVDDCYGCLVSASPGLDIEAAAGTVEITGAIGAVSAPGDIWISADGSIDVADIDTDGSIFMRGNGITLNGGHYSASEGINIQGDTVLTRATSVTAGGDVDIVGTVDMLPGADGGDALPVPTKGPVEIISRGGNVSLAKAVGAAGSLGSLLVSAAEEIFLARGVWTDGGQTYDASRVTATNAILASTSAGIAIDGSLEASGDVTLQAATDIDIAGTIDSLRGEGSGLARVGMTAGREIRLLGAVGQGAALGSFELVAGVRIDPLSVTTFGAQSYSAPIVILSGSRYETNGGTFTTSGNLSLTAPEVTIVTTGSGGDGDILLEGAADGADVTLDAGDGDITGLNVTFNRLTVMSTTGSATMGGSLGDISGVEAAADVLRPDGIAATYLFNDCVMATSCGGPPPPVGSIDPEGTIKVTLPPPLVLPQLSPTPLIVLATDDPLDDPRFVLSNTGKDTLWRLDLLLPDATREGGQ